MLDEISKEINQCLWEQSQNKNSIHRCINLIELCLEVIELNANFSYYGDFNSKEFIKKYYTYSNKYRHSRPVNYDFFIRDYNLFYKEAIELIKQLEEKEYSNYFHERSLRVIYTAVMSIACCFDIWKPGSRKTPGTFFEVIMIALLRQQFPNYEFSKHFIDPANELNLSTDLVIKNGHNSGVVIPLKITTRERIVQPYVHQRIINNLYGQGKYVSLLTCISENQLNSSNRTIKQICVPGTIKLYEQHISSLYAIYYCDPPQIYVQENFQDIISVKYIGYLFEDLEHILSTPDLPKGNFL